MFLSKMYILPITKTLAKIMWVIEKIGYLRVEHSTNCNDCSLFQPNEKVASCIVNY